MQRIGPRICGPCSGVNDAAFLRLITDLYVESYDAEAAFFISYTSGGKLIFHYSLWDKLTIGSSIAPCILWMPDHGLVFLLVSEFWWCLPGHTDATPTKISAKSHVLAMKQDTQWYGHGLLQMKRARIVMWLHVITRCVSLKSTWILIECHSEINNQISLKL